ncbi:tripartite tricarboxylate transporter permease [Bradyrhizobium sp. LM2.3]
MPSAARGDVPRRVPLTKQGRGGAALGITVLSSFVGASWGILEMIFLAPVLVKVALEFGPTEICSLMLLGLLAGSTLAKGSPLQRHRHDVARAVSRNRGNGCRDRLGALHVRHPESP